MTYFHYSMIRVNCFPKINGVLVYVLLSSVVFSVGLRRRRRYQWEWWGQEVVFLLTEKLAYVCLIVRNSKKYVNEYKI